MTRQDSSKVRFPHAPRFDFRLRFTDQGDSPKGLDRGRFDSGLVTNRITKDWGVGSKGASSESSEKGRVDMGSQQKLQRSPFVQKPYSQKTEDKHMSAAGNLLS